MFSIVTVVGVHVLYCDSSRCTCSVLSQRYVYKEILLLEIYKRTIKHWVASNVLFLRYWLSGLALKQ